MDASRDYEVLDPHKQFGDWNASWTKFKFPSRQFIKPVSIPIPPFPTAYMCPRFQAPDSPELHFPSFVLKLPSSLHWPHFAGGMETSSGWMLFVVWSLHSPEWSLCRALNFPSQECSDTESIQLSSIFWGKRMEQSSLPKGQFRHGSRVESFWQCIMISFRSTDQAGTCSMIQGI